MSKVPSADWGESGSNLTEVSALPGWGAGVDETEGWEAIATGFSEMFTIQILGKAHVR